jgi:carboxyl-terminal processing protease
MGRTVRLEVQRADETPRVVALVCQDAPVETVVGLYRDTTGKWVHVVDPNNRVAYFRIREFDPSTMEEFQTAYRQVDGMSGLVLDLRDNPGGRLPAAVAVADLFLAQGTIVTVTDRGGESRHYVARPEGTYPADLPIVVLIDGRTASAAEIVAGALRLGRRAVLVGTRTRGKGYVQSMIQLPGDMGQINLTTSEWLLGEDRRISRRAGSETWGIDPHVEISVPPAKRERLALLRARCELPAVDKGNLSPSRPTPTVMPVTASTGPNEPPIGVSLLEIDAPLARAVELLRSPQDIRELLDAADEATSQTRQAVQRGAAPSAATQPALGEK